jgi:hypothetical protein
MVTVVMQIQYTVALYVLYHFSPYIFFYGSYNYMSAAIDHAS